MFKWLSFLFIFSVLNWSCTKSHNSVTRGFYFWQSNLSSNTLNSGRLDSLNIESLYVKFFDVTMDEASQQPIPVADISFEQPVPANISIIPVVFITNNTLENLDTIQCKYLAQKIAKRIQYIIDTNNLALPSEIQIDCDWTATTRQNYFILLQTIKQYPAFNKVQISSTIRLHQIKYYKTTGVPPVDKGLLMFYNMGNIEDDKSVNSIYDENIAAQYVDNINAYPLALDAAIACYSWGLLYDNHQLLRIFYPLYLDEISDSLFSKVENNTYKANGNFYFEGQFFVSGNILKIESMTPELSLRAAEQLAGNLHNEKINVILFHFDEIILKKYSNEDLEAIYNCFE